MCVHWRLDYLEDGIYAHLVRLVLITRDYGMDGK
jgi:hypothetical protein